MRQVARCHSIGAWRSWAYLDGQAVGLSVSLCDSRVLTGEGMPLSAGDGRKAFARRTYGAGPRVPWQRAAERTVCCFHGRKNPWLRADIPTAGGESTGVMR